uniref:High mobility group AT-hook 1a n=1 Tax=Neolamprologus brichardi TaxID=32507 RepID=A0A3Q4N2D0_NEOBR
NRGTESETFCLKQSDGVFTSTRSTSNVSPQEPVGPPTPKRPRGRPKGSKNKGPRTALKGASEEAEEGPSSSQAAAQEEGE